MRRRVRRQFCRLKKILPLNDIAVNSSTPYTVTTDPNLDYSRFTHSNDSHARLPCLLCHQTDQSPSKLKFPGKNGHLPCAGCHVEQFKANEGPICSICHTDTVSGEMKPFPAYIFQSQVRSFKTRFTGKLFNLSRADSKRSGI